MSSAGVQFLDDERLSPLALSARPAWLWSLEATRILWANPTGAAVFGAANPAAIARRRFDAGQPAAAQIAQLASKLSEGAPAQVERLRGFGAGVGRALACACSRITFGEGTPAILVVAAERAGPDLSLNERIVRLFAGCEAPLAIFAPDGTLIHATLAADAYLHGASSLAALGAGATGSDALRLGHAQGVTAHGPVAIKRHGSDADLVLVADFAAASATLAAATSSEGDTPPLPAAAEASIAAPKMHAPSDAADPLRAPPAATPAPPAPSSAAGERRHPLRFVWQMDEDDRFTVGSDEFIALIGPRTAAALGRPWPDLATEFGLDPDGRVAQAIASRNTWSGLTVAWPLDDNAERLTVEMSGLPVFDRERAFRGYRGFGVCRDLARLAALGRPANGTEPATAAPAELGCVSQPPAAAPPTETAISSSAAEPAAPALSALEHHAFHELSRRLAQRLNNSHDEKGDHEYDVSHVETDAFVTAAHDVRDMFDRLPLGVLIYRLDQLLYANPAFLQAVGHRSLEELSGAGGLDSLLVTPASENVDEASGEPLALTIERGERGKLEAELIRIDWEGEMAHALVTKTAVVVASAAGRVVPASTGGVQPVVAAAPANAELAELRSILDTATDGVVMLDRTGKVLSANRSAEALFGHETDAFARFSLFDLLAPESHDVASAYLDSLREDGIASMLNSGREVMGRVGQGGLLPLFMTLGTVGESGEKLCAVFRDLSQWKKTEAELISAKRQAEKASSAKSDFLAKISHEIRTPLNAIIGFSEVMMEERFGAVGNERYRGYLKDIHASGGHLLSLINDLLDLSKIEAGKLDLTFASVSLNDLTQQCVAILQPQANREHVIIRTALAPKLPPVLADARSVRQIVLNLVTNSIKFTGAGGQVIVSTALKDDGEVALRVRDTGIGMSEKDIATALEPFRQVATAAARPGGTGLGLPLTKALAEANRASFRIKSAPKEGTLVEVAFAAGQVLVA